MSDRSQYQQRQRQAEPPTVIIAGVTIPSDVWRDARAHFAGPRPLDGVVAIRRATTGDLTDAWRVYRYWQTNRRL